LDVVISIYVVVPALMFLLYIALEIVHTKLRPIPMLSRFYPPAEPRRGTIKRSSEAAGGDATRAASSAAAPASPTHSAAAVASAAGAASAPAIDAIELQPVEQDLSQA
jgi:hypothetical protein